MMFSVLLGVHLSRVICLTATIYIFKKVIVSRQKVDLSYRKGEYHPNCFCFFSAIMI